jgi:exosortase/archaeosortase family protein
VSNPHFSFIILTWNEELHIKRLLESVSPLNAQIHVLDSGSEDKTLDICKAYGAETKYNRFLNHPRQWHAALNLFSINTPWVICLDADQIVSAELLKKLQEFKNENYSQINGIYFNRKNYFKGKWLRYGGYYPKFLLKMFRYNTGYSDLNENMDHRFQVPGKTVIWKKPCLIEENLKENQISFWIDKHNRYSDLLADEALMKKGTTNNMIKPKPWGSPNQHNAWLKQIWHGLPLYLRPFLYFFYRMIFQLGILDGRTGITFHFLQGFWFRLLVDIKIEEQTKALELTHKKKSNPIRFLLRFLCFFFIFYLFNIIHIALITPGGYYSLFIDMHLNYIDCWRKFCISSATWILKSLGYLVQASSGGLTVKGHSGFKLVYSCLGYSIMSSFAAFVISFPKPVTSRIKFLIAGLTGIQLLNTIRLVLVALFYNQKMTAVDHHDLFNYSMYAILAISVYIWTNHHANHPAKEEF